MKTWRQKEGKESQILKKRLEYILTDLFHDRPVYISNYTFPGKNEFEQIPSFANVKFFVKVVPLFDYYLINVCFALNCKGSCVERIS